MKNARKYIGEVAEIDPTQIAPGPIVTELQDCIPNFDSPVFNHRHMPRQPESPYIETFRSMIKSNLPKYKASPALRERIRRIIDDEKI